MNDGNNNIDVAVSPMKLITPEELSDWLKVPLSWIYDRTRKSGPDGIPHYKLGRYLRFSIPEIEDYLGNQAAQFSLTTAKDIKDMKSEFVKI